MTDSTQTPWLQSRWVFGGPFPVAIDLFVAKLVGEFSGPLPGYNRPLRGKACSLHPLLAGLALLLMLQTSGLCLG